MLSFLLNLLLPPSFFHSFLLQHLSFQLISALGGGVSTPGFCSFNFYHSSLHSITTPTSSLIHVCSVCLVWLFIILAVLSLITFHLLIAFQYNHSLSIHLTLLFLIFYPFFPFLSYLSTICISTLSCLSTIRISTYLVFVVLLLTLLLVLPLPLGLFYNYSSYSHSDFTFQFSSKFHYTYKSNRSNHSVLNSDLLVTCPQITFQSLTVLQF